MSAHESHSDLHVPFAPDIEGHLLHEQNEVEAKTDPALHLSWKPLRSASQACGRFLKVSRAKLVPS